METGKEHIAVLDYIRAAAALGVFAFHTFALAYDRSDIPCQQWLASVPSFFWSLLTFPATLGWAGVAVFFVVSGFCVHLSFLRNAQQGWRGFFIRRFFRIYPPYLVSLLLFALVFPNTRLGFGCLYEWLQMGSHVLLLHNLSNRLFLGINESFWSIAVEAQLYLLYPLLLALAAKIGWRRVLIAVGILELALRGSVCVYEALARLEAPRWISGSPFYYWYSWAIGAALADAFANKRPLPFCSLPTVFWLLAAIGCSLVQELQAFSFFFFALTSATLLAKLLFKKRADHGDGRPIQWLANIGACSYSLYLLHQPILSLIPFVLKKMAVPVPLPEVLFGIGVCCCPLIVAVSWYYYKWCEQPSITLGKRFLPKTKSLSQEVLSQRTLG